MNPLKAKKTDHIPRSPRLRELCCSNIYFRLRDKQQTKIRIVNLSTTGIGLLSKDLDKQHPEKSFLRGELCFRNLIFPVALKIIHHTGEIIGCEFHMMDFENKMQLRKLIQSYVKVEVASIQLREVHPQFLSKEFQKKEGTPRWYLGEDGCEIYLLEKKEQVIQYYFSFFGNYFEWQEDEKLISGKITQSNAQSPLHYSRSEMVHIHTKIPEETLFIAKHFIKNTSVLSENQKQFILKTLHI